MLQPDCSDSQDLATFGYQQKLARTLGFLVTP